MNTRISTSVRDLTARAAALALLAGLLALLAGCAGGLKNGGASTPNNATTGTTAAAGATGTSTATTPAADVAVFVWRGEGNSVAVAGEFNAWNTSADMLVKQADGSWRLEKKLAPGRYPYKFVIDGGTWKEDPTAKETVDDGFGGKNSVVVIGGGAAAAAGTGAAMAVKAETPVTGKGKAPVVAAEGVTFTYAGIASSVHLAGEFNAWSTTADPMAKQADGSWTLTKKLPSGTYSYKFVVDGSTWKQDEANPEAKDDGFGGKNSVLVVP